MQRPFAAAALLALLASAGHADVVVFEREDSFNGGSAVSNGLPAAAGDVTITFRSRTYRDEDVYGGECFERSLAIEGQAVATLGCPQWFGCDWVSHEFVVDASLFNRWREGGISLAMSWQSGSCGLAWSVRYEYPIVGIDRVDAFAGDTGASMNLPPAASPVTIEFRSTTYRPYDKYGGSPCFGRTLFLEGSASISLTCNGFGCNETAASISVDPDDFNTWIEDGLFLTMSWQSADCGLGWTVRYLYETLPDCNGNGRDDEIDLAIGTSPDCNGDGIPDECQGIEIVDRSSGPTAPFGAGIPASATFGALPPALAIVEISFVANGDLDSSSEAVIPVLDGVQFPPLFAGDGRPCGEASIGTLLLLPDEFATLAADGILNVQAIATAPVNPFECPETSITISLRYAAITDAADCDDDGTIDLCSKGGIGADCNLNGIGDLCDVQSGFDSDCDGDGLPDSCEMISDPEADKNLNFVLDRCEIARGDLDLDGEVGPSDLAVLLSLWGLSGDFVPDLDGDGLVGPGDLAILLANWQSIVEPPCGNGLVNAFEDCETCPPDVWCDEGSTCVQGACVPCPPPPYGGSGCGYGGLANSFDGYRHREGLGLDPNFRHFARLPVGALAAAAIAVSLLALGLVRFR
jgi:hypothetical protein